MALDIFVATATTCDVSPGTEQVDDHGQLHIRSRTFTDIVESDDLRVAGSNEPTLDIDMDPSTGTGELRGRFVLTPKAADGTWEGELRGELKNGMVTASGLAKGTGSLGDTVMQVSFRQVPAHPGTPPCDEPKAFFEISGQILQ